MMCSVSLIIIMIIDLLYYRVHFYIGVICYLLYNSIHFKASFTSKLHSLQSFILYSLLAM